MKTSRGLTTAVALLAGAISLQGQEGLNLIRAGQTHPAAGVATTQIKSVNRLLSGQGWETTIVLMDLGSTAVSFRQSFFGGNGAAASFNVNLPPNNTNLTTSALQGMIGPSGMVSFTLTGDGSSLQEGWSLLTYDGIPNQLSGYSVLRHKMAGGTVTFEATFPFDNMMDSSARMPFDNTRGFQTQLTIVNPASNLSAQVQLTYINAQGQVTLLDSIGLKPGEQATLTLPNTYPDLANQAGTVAILANINCLSVSGLRLNPTSGSVAALPVMDFTAGVALQ
ncbi:MAG TPA: hypothetical protein VKT49_17420 [Bryobacteraceae bacterium]|nr:hypothetical protein [Bryobacteraceae bacterium]